MRLAEIEWLDAGLEHVQMGLEQAKNLEAMSRHNVGYLLHKDRHKIVLAFGDVLDKDHNALVWDCCLIIPRPMIKRIRELHLRGE